MSAGFAVCLGFQTSLLSSSSSSVSLFTSNLSPKKVIHSSNYSASLVPRKLFLDSRKKSLNKAVVKASNRPSPFPDYLTEAVFYKVEAILRPWRVSHVAAGLLKIGIRGVTVSDCKGFGAQGGFPERQAGSEFSEDNFVSKVKMEIVVSKDQVESVINNIIEEARTGEIGDGKIFVIPVADVIRVRTGERGVKAERMMGGRTELLSGKRSSTVGN